MKIYHYTSIESLYMIIKNRKLRFSTLSNVDDLDEGMTEEFELARQYLFVSCWTEEAIESIPQWAIYSNNMEGIRIGINLPKDNPRKIFELIEDPITGSLISEALGVTQNFPLVASAGTPFYRQMKYTDNKEKLKPKITSYERQEISIDMSKVALYKSLEWSFQNESRFIIDFHATPINEDRSANKNFNILEAMEVNNLPFTYKDIELSNYFFENLEITFGPKCPEVHQDFVKMYLKKFKINASVKNSSLNIQ